MSNDVIEKLDSDTVGHQILQFIPNNLGINLCSVEDITINRMNDKLVSINIDFKIDTGVCSGGAVAS